MTNNSEVEELKSRIRELERTNTFFKQAIRQGDHIRRQWQKSTRELKATKASLAQSQKYLEQVLKNTPDPLIVVNHNGQIILANKAMDRLIGKSAEGLTRPELLRLIAPNDRRSAKATFRAFINSNSQLNLEVSILSASGQSSLLATQWAAIRNSQGAITEVIISGRDVTRQKSIDAQLRRAAAVFETAAEGILITDADGVIEAVNPMFTTITGYGETDVVGRSPRFLQSGCHDSCFYTTMWNTLLKSGRWQGEVWSRHKTAKIYPQWLSISTVCNPRGAISHYIGMFTDITERKQWEKELVMTRENALALAQAKSNFLANMSHEIRTPMNGVLGMTELLMGTMLTEKQQKFGQAIQRSAKALLAIINDVLDFSKIEAGKLKLEHIPFELDELLDDIAELLAEHAREKDLELHTHLGSDVPCRLIGDATRLRQVLVNLMGNAIKFTEQGEVLVKISLEADNNADTLLRFEILDTGIGISEQAQRNIFSSFVQADATTTRQYGGTGLGLAISSQLVKLMGGDIGLESTLGKGSTFWFTTRLEKQVPRQHPGTHPAKTLQGLRVLVVDDNASSCAVLGYKLENLRVRTGLARSGQDALRMLRLATDEGSSYHLAILDQRMPGMDGITLAHAIKQDSAISATRLIMCSALRENDDTARWRDAGIEAYLTKPARQSELIDAISKVTQVPRIKGSQGLETVTSSVALRLSGHILLAEDNPVNQDVAVGMLEQLGCRVKVVETGREVITALSQQYFDVVLMDCQMPQMDGFAATEAIRRREQAAGTSSHIPIIAVTANAMAGDREKCLIVGMDDFLSKPYTQTQLGEVLARWLANKPTPNEREFSPSLAVLEALEATEDDSAHTAVLNQAALDNIRSLQQPGEPNILRKIIGRYVENSPQLLRSLREAMAQHDIACVRLAAHSLKSSSASLGAMALSESCKTLETMAREQRLEDAEILLTDIETGYAVAAKALGRYCESKRA
jgi:two-component system sensor histidine kinase/response regulator